MNIYKGHAAYGGATPEGVSDNRESEGKKTRWSFGRGNEKARMQRRQYWSLHRMKMGMIQERQRHGAETLRAEGAALAAAGIMLGTRRLLRRGRIRHTPVIAIMRHVNGMGIACLDRHGQRGQGGRPRQRPHQQQGYYARKSSQTQHVHTLPVLPVAKNRKTAFLSLDIIR